MEKRVRNIVIGSLLGDGWLESLSPEAGTSSFRVKYNDKSLGYLSWIRNQVKELEPSPLKSKPDVQQHYFYTRWHKNLGELRKLFYPNEGKKRVPTTIEKLLNDPIGLAVWYQDDGTLDRRSKYHWNIRLATYCFPYEDCVRLQQMLLQNFNIEVSVCRCQMRGKVYFQLYVLARSMQRFVELVKPYIHNNFAYKILDLPS